MDLVKKMYLDGKETLTDNEKLSIINNFIMEFEDEIFDCDSFKELEELAQDLIDYVYEVIEK